MSDIFFKQKHCSRCGHEMTSRIMSMFSKEVICLDCKLDEQSHPDYAAAREVEVNEYLKGTVDYKGVGSPFEVTFQDRSEDGDLFKLEDFIRDVKQYAIMDDDGYGHYGIGDAESNIPVDCSEILEGVVDTKKPWTTVIWYNR